MSIWDTSPIVIGIGHRGGKSILVPSVVVDDDGTVHMDTCPPWVLDVKVCRTVEKAAEFLGWSVDEVRKEMSWLEKRYEEIWGESDRVWRQIIAEIEAEEEADQQPLNNKE